MTTRMQ